MKTILKASLTSMMLTSVAFGAVATMATFASVDVAYAKSGKSSDKSDNGRGNSSEARSNKGNSGNKSASRGASNRGADHPSTKLIGKEKRAAKAMALVTAEGSTKAAKGKKTVDGAFHPSELGNMNGALNANINAVLAHIRNGNGNGPVGHVAVLAVATANAEGGQETLDRAALFEALEAGSYESVEDYYVALDGTPGIDPIEAIDLAEDQEQAAIDAGFGSYDDYLDQRETTFADPDDGIDSALETLGYDVEGRDEAPVDLALDPTDPSVGEAADDLADEMAAEQSILAYWNKNPGGDADPATGLTADEEQLLNDLRARFSEEDQIAIKNAVEEVDLETVEDEVDVCTEVDGVCEAEDDLAAL